MSLSFQTPGYEDFELSTQIVIAEALKRGVTVEVLDAQTQFLRLTKGDRIEYVESATKTSRDSYVTSLILGNKVVTKLLLKEKGLRVPDGRHYSNYEDALKDYNFFVSSGQMVVVKPKTTNYGVGVEILGKKFAKKAFVDAITNAFGFDDAVLVEEFIEGIECRFLVIDGRCVAVLHRVPANVTGDGKHSIHDLVLMKNDDPLRGRGYKTPLEKIQLGDVENHVLQSQRLSFESVPANGKRVFLRRNSNISTGGDSIDYTDRVHQGYKDIAVQAAAAAGAKICGVDMIGSAFDKKPTASNHAVIELNWNPVLYFHDFPFQGKNRHVEKHLLDLLGF